MPSNVRISLERLRDTIAESCNVHDDILRKAQRLCEERCVNTVDRQWSR